MTKIKDLPVNPPDYLGGTARYMWRRLVPLIKSDPTVNEMDKTMVETFCVNYQLMRDSYKHVLENGAVSAVYKTIVNPVNGKVVAKDFTGYKRNPSTQILDSATAKLKALGSELGLTPKGRAELLDLKIPDNDSDKLSVADQVKNILKGGNEK
ncbi:phage terminase small subunit P27 family [Oenococcus alcoholitolerans]|uniref:phage terminase small subunit P27 family n=1 Tax=Oenococcus alcoholitolerans TaxID=931074 RepID=UPI003F6FD63A